MLKDAAHTIGHMLDMQSTVTISSVDAEGFPCTRAMLGIRAREGIKTIYFSTNTASTKVAQYRQNPKACIYFCDKRFYKGCMLKGTVAVLTDPETKARFWQEGDALYYPKGVTDPDYCVLQFTIHSGRYYSNFASEDFEV